PRVRADFFQLASPAIQARQERAVVGAGIVKVDVSWIGRDVSGLAAASLVGCDLTSATGTAEAPPTEIRRAVNAHRRGVLLGTADVVGHVPGRDDVVELPGRIVLVGPGPLSDVDVVADGPAAIIADDDVFRVIRVDPEIVVISMRAAADVREGLAAIGGA